MKNKRSFLPVAVPSIGPRERRYVSDAMRSGWVSSMGPYVQPFEDKFASFCDVPYAIAVANGTVALHLALKVLGIGKGDEVILPSMTFVATANAVMYCGAVPVFVDSDPETWCMDPRAIEAAVSRKTRAIIAVHIYGHPCDMKAISLIAKKHHLKVIEDAAEAHGAEYYGHPVGSLSDIGVFSFYGNKIITTGEGGALTMHSASLAARARFLKDHGMSLKRRYWHSEVGFNYRMTNIQAAMGLAQLERASELLKKKRTYFRWYQDALRDVPGVRLNPVTPGLKSVPWLICLDLRLFSESQKKRLPNYLKAAKIDWRPFFIPMHHLPMYKRHRAVSARSTRSGCPVADELSTSCFNLPSGYGLGRKDVEYVCETIRRFAGNGPHH